MKYYIVGASDFAREKFKPEEDAFVIAADAGVLYTGERADLAIGDWDSLFRVPEGVNTVTLPVAKDHTDTGEAIDYALSHGAEEIVLFGASGGRTDHYLANLQYLVTIADAGVKASMVCPDCTIYAMAEGVREFYGKGSMRSRDRVKEPPDRRAGFACHGGEWNYKHIELRSPRFSYFSVIFDECK